MHRSWVGYGSDRNGGKYVENGWQNLWQSRQSDGNFDWDKKGISDDNWDTFSKHKWSWGNGGSHGWGKWSNDFAKNDQSGDWSDSVIQRPEFYTSWGNTNTDSWKNSGGGEKWSKWEADDQGSDGGNREYTGWRNWKSNSGGRNWKSWKNGPDDENLNSWKNDHSGENRKSWKGANKIISAQARAIATASIDP
ncbi:unnamed protein product [Cercopithifilaria johnstoni]|uniref:Uncharacterized protein n=1 Tax=Cercopithifilaria johnstoni TaxID=2874296 RepID=A0A8J2QAS1_9BILA|nr:unnamed protein product [Cercopithifilaria johnstoni]